MLKLLTLLTEKIINKLFPSEEERADMYLPARYLSMSLVLRLLGLLAALFALFGTRMRPVCSVAAVLLLGLGIAEFLCWKNQTVRVLTEETFEYTTFLGNKTVYRFSDVKGFRHSRDSSTLYVADGKVHIESGALLTERLVSKLDECFGVSASEEE
jgi:hypothetical protein